MFTVLRNFIRSESGATAVEYGLLVALIGVAVGSVIVNLGNIVRFVYNYVLTNVVAAAS
ncbi:MAG TPA: Flp family type IVb pilin [Methylomirabilota bacterium]|nr:Flp family type IVb pilin [Methylomirabilota bacterium]